METATLRTTVNSFDLFDTLMARRCVDPYSIFLAVEKSLSAPGFAAARRDAEYRLAASGAAFDIHDIYDLLVSSNILARADADKLLAAELDEEFDNAVPIVENIQRVREGDLIISDMYLPQDVLRRLLHHIGLRMHVHLYVTNLGKHHGHVWADITSRWIIATHLGDNPHSDIASPKAAGIPAHLYTGAQPSQWEILIAQHGQPALARIMRSLRLRNPYPSGSNEHELWVLACQLNLPLLVSFIRMIRERRQATGARKILFSARDCYFLSEIFPVLFPAEPSEYLFVSREVLTTGSTGEYDYLLGKGIADNLVCDIAATGSSWAGFVQRHRNPANVYPLVFIDDWKLARMSPEAVLATTGLRFGFAVRTSSLKTYSPAIEVLNTAPHGSCLRLLPTGRFFSPQLMKEQDLPPQVVAPLLQCHQAILAALREDRIHVVTELAASDTTQLVPTLIEAISSSTLLNSLGERLLWPPSFGRTTN